MKQIKRNKYLINQKEGRKKGKWGNKEHMYKQKTNGKIIYLNPAMTIIILI